MVCGMDEFYKLLLCHFFCTLETTIVNRIVKQKHKLKDSVNKKSFFVIHDYDL